MHMEQTTWLKLELETAETEWRRSANELLDTTATAESLALSRYQADYWNGYVNALTNALNNLEGMTDNEPELPSHYLPSEVRNQTLTPETLERIAQDLRHQGVSGLNVALALDLITN